MERRWSRRKQVTQEVLLRYEGLGLMRCETRNVSFEGACINTGQFSVPIAAQVELVFPQHQNTKVEDVCIGASVVRTYKDGIGVNFSHYHNGSYKYLLELLD